METAETPCRRRTDGGTSFEEWAWKEIQRLREQLETERKRACAAELELLTLRRNLGKLVAQ